VNLPNKLSILRVIFAPLFYIIYFLPHWTGLLYIPSAIALAVLFLGMEISDVLDGYIARQQNLTSDIGKVLDPFSDVITRTTFFLCFTVDQLFPPWLFLLFLYREISIIFIRLLLIRKGIALAARKGGKIKSLFYAFAAGGGILDVFLDRMGIEEKYLGYVGIGAVVIFGIAVLFAIISFVDYLLVFRNHQAGKAEK
jgi:CDP-diacylglycerol--glycerol-3-phosphate 3-phosphatidyltransferase